MVIAGNSSRLGQDSRCDSNLPDQQTYLLAECVERWSSESARIYVQVCRKLGLVPISYYLRHIDDHRLVLRHHSIDELAAKAIAAPLTVRTIPRV